MKYKRNLFKNNEISLMVLTTVLLSEFISLYAMFMVCIVLIVWEFIYRKNLRFVLFPGVIIWFLMFVIGLFGLSSYETWPILRDIIYFSMLPVFWILSCLIIKNHNISQAGLIKTLFLSIGLLSIIKNAIKIISIIEASSVDFSVIRNSGGITEIVLAIGFYLAFFPKIKKGDFYLDKKIDLFLKASIALSTLLSFSRLTFLFITILIVLSSKNRALFILRMIIIMIIGIIVIKNIFPNEYTFFVEKLLSSLTEISSVSTNWNVITIQTNWRGYEVYCAQKAFSGYSLVQQLFGKGFGASVDAFGYAELVTDESTIAWLHNGYYTSLIKLGLIGLVLNIVFYIDITAKIYMRQIEPYYKMMILALGIIITISSIFISGLFWRGISFTMIMFMSGLYICRKDINEKRGDN